MWSGGVRCKAQVAQPAEAGSAAGASAARAHQPAFGHTKLRRPLPAASCIMRSVRALSPADTIALPLRQYRTQNSASSILARHAFASPAPPRRIVAFSLEIQTAASLAAAPPSNGRSWTMWRFKAQRGGAGCRGGEKPSRLKLATTARASDDSWLASMRQRPSMSGCSCLRPSGGWPDSKVAPSQILGLVPPIWIVGRDETFMTASCRAAGRTY